MMVRRSWILILAACVCGLPLILAADKPASQSAADLATGTEAPPAGYRSMTAIKFAILTGQLKLVDRNIVVPETISVRRGITYGTGGDQPLKLDLYSPKQLAGPVPALIFIHGGAWKKGKRSDYHYYCVKFAERGYVVATITYRLLPKHAFPAAVEDAKCAVRWMRANAGKLHVNPNLIGAIGGSAGGHLAMMVGYSSDVPELEGHGGHPGVSSRVQAVVDLYGPTDLTTPFAVNNPTAINFLGGRKIGEARKQYELASPITHVTKDDPPTLIFHGSIDETVPVAQSDMLTKKLKAVGVPVTYDRLTGWPHTMDAAAVVNRRCRRLMNRFFDKYLPLPK